MDLDDDTHREDQFSSSYETPTVTATHKEPTGMRPKFFEESILKQRREIERLQELLAAREQQLNEQGNLIDKMKAPFEPAPVTDPTLTPRVPRPQDIALPKYACTLAYSLHEGGNEVRDAHFPSSIYGVHGVSKGTTV